jgi:hypothetical protein
MKGGCISRCALGAIGAVGLPDSIKVSCKLTPSSRSSKSSLNGNDMGTRLGRVVTCNVSSPDGLNDYDPKEVVVGIDSGTKATERLLNDSSAIVVDIKAVSDPETSVSRLDLNGGKIIHSMCHAFKLFAFRWKCNWKRA